MNNWRESAKRAGSRVVIGSLATLIGCNGQPSSRGGEQTGRIAAQMFANGDFEDDPASPPYTQWTVAGYYNTGVTLSSPQTRLNLNLEAGGVPDAAILSAAEGPGSQVDASLGAGASLRWPRYGQQVAYVNTIGTNSNATSLKQTTTLGVGDIDPADGNVHVRFAIAPVLQSAGHAAGAQPYYFVQLTNLTRNVVVYRDYNASGQPGVPWKLWNGAYYTDWQLVDIAPTGADAALGDSVELEVIAAGCSEGDHYGRVYVDGVSSTVPGLFVTATGPASATAGTDIVYTLSYRNGGASVASHVDVELNTPPSTVYRSVNAPGLSCTEPAQGSTGKLTCSVGVLPPGAGGSFQVTVGIDSGAAGTILAGDYDVLAAAVSPLIGPKVFTVVTPIGPSIGPLRALTVTKLGSGHGTVGSVPAAIACGLGCAGAAGSFLDGSTVILSAIPAPGDIFFGWSGACAGKDACMITLSQDALVEATFASPLKSAGNACGAGSECESGSCVDDVCCNTACGGGDTTDCQACNLEGSLGTCIPFAVGSVCRPAADVCDRVEVCEGDNPLCPADAFEPATTVCRALAGPCDVAEVCTGTEVACPADAFAPATTVYSTAFCALGAELPVASCSGVAALSPLPVLHPCGPYLCGVDACLTACSTTSDCAAGNLCKQGVCVAQSPVAATCGDDAMCLSGHCADGVCCDAACKGQCEACDVSGSAGTCSPVAGPPRSGREACAGDGSVCSGQCDGVDRAHCAYPGEATSCRDASCSAHIATLAAVCDGDGSCPQVDTQACAPFTCGSQACLGECAKDADCDAGSFCQAEICVAKRALGENCTVSSACESDFCIDGVCCNSACEGQCEACNGVESPGLCQPANGPPRGKRPACASDGSLCGGYCNGVQVDTCLYPATSITCRAGACADGVATLEASCDGVGSCPAKQEQSCAPFVCGSELCLGDCAGDADCQQGQFCSAGVCIVKLVNGASCADAAQCGSGFCVDGLCCDVACDGQCEACDVPGSLGMCSPTAGQPHGAREACKGEHDSTCGGVCDGAHRAACVYPDAGVTCRAPSCKDGVATLAAACDGSGACPASIQQGCGDLTCGPDACLGGCSMDADCAAGHFCSAGVCAPQQVAGEACSNVGQCGSGFCADGVCCDVACDGQCQACDVAGSKGVCSAVAGKPRGSRAACEGEGACGATCDGATTDACVFAVESTTCAPASCSLGQARGVSTCDGAGTCRPGEAKDCGTYACEDAACVVECTLDAQCVNGNTCERGICKLREPFQYTEPAQAACSLTRDATAGLSPWLVGLAALLFTRRRRDRG